MNKDRYPLRIRVKIGSGKLDYCRIFYKFREGFLSVVGCASIEFSSCDPFQIACNITLPYERKCFVTYNYKIGRKYISFTLDLKGLFV